MISLIVTTDGDTNYNLEEKDAEFGKVMEQFAEPYEIIYTICSDYGFKDELSRIVCQQKNRHLIISAPSTNINTQIYSAMDVSDNGDVLLCTIDTNPKVMLDILNKHFDGADLVFVRHKENWFKSIFTSLGKAAYQMGLKILGHGQDLCCDARVIYLNSRSINTIIMNPTLSKALRLVNADPEKTLRVVSEKDIYGNPTFEQQQINKSIFTLGIVTFVYILALLAMALVYPLCNGGTYSGWVLIVLVLWILAGILASVLSSRVIYRTRLGYPVAVDLQNEPVLNIEDYISYNYELAKRFYSDDTTTASSTVDMLKAQAGKINVLKAKKAAEAAQKTKEDHKADKKAQKQTKKATKSATKQQAKSKKAAEKQSAATIEQDKDDNSKEHHEVKTKENADTSASTKEKKSAVSGKKKSKIKKEK